VARHERHRGVRTAALGGHLERCDQCGYERNAFNSCRDRHCPKCQCLARAQWIEQRQSELLDVPYFHVVFTVPEEIAAIAYQNKKVIYDILFQATAETLKTIAADPKHLGAEIGFFAVLHSWGRTSSSTRTCIVSCPVAACPPMASGGFRAGRISSSPSGFCPISFVDCSCSRSSMHSIPAS